MSYNRNRIVKKAYKETRQFETWRHKLVLKSVDRDGDESPTLLEIARGLQRLIA